MNESRTIQLVEIPIGGKGGFVWQHLHQEREDICEALLARSETASQTHQHQELLEARLRKIDDALDRLMSGSYGICSKCGCSIEHKTLELDVAAARCRDCSDHESRTSRAGINENEIILERLNSFDTILLHTQNSDYRILLLDPATGRALVDGGNYLPEPSEGLVKGSALPGSAFNGGAICVGGRLEMWVDDKVFLTSPIATVDVQHNATAESLESISAALR